MYQTKKYFVRIYNIVQLGKIKLFSVSKLLIKQLKITINYLKLKLTECFNSLIIIFFFLKKKMALNSDFLSLSIKIERT